MGADRWGLVFGGWALLASFTKFFAKGLLWGGLSIALGNRAQDPPCGFKRAGPLDPASSAQLLHQASGSTVKVVDSASGSTQP